MNDQQDQTFSVFSFIRNSILGIILAIIILLCVVWGISGHLIKAQISDQITPFNLVLNEESYIKLNPFIGQLIIENLSLTSSDTQVEQLAIDLAIVDLNFKTLFSRQITFDQLLLDGIRLKASQDQAGVVAIAKIPVSQGQSEPESAAQEQQQNTESKQKTPWTVDIANSDIERIEVDFDDGYLAHQLVIDKLVANKALLSSEKQLISVAIDGSVNNAQLKAKSDLEIIKGLGKIETEINLSDFTFQKLEHFFPVQVTKLSGTSGLDIKVSTHINETATSLKVDTLEFTTDQLILDLGKMKSEVENIHLSGRDISLLLPRSDNTNTFDPSIAVDGEFDLSLDNYVLFSLLDGSELLSLKKFSMDPLALEYQSNEVMFESQGINIEGLAVAKSLNESGQNLSLIDINTLTLSDIKLAANKIAINAIDVGAISSNIVLDKEQKLSNEPLLSALKLFETGYEAPQSDDNETEPVIEEAEIAATEPAFIYEIGEVNLSEPTHIYYKDQSFKTRFERHIEITTLTLTSISNATLDHETSFSLMADVQHHAKIELSGKIKPLTEKVNLKVQAKLAELSLPNISAYMGAMSGIEFLSGQLDSDIDLAVTDDQLSGEANLQMRGVTLSGNSDEQGGVIGEGSSISLNRALSMLKDSNDNLELDIPLSGDISSPSFGWGSFVNIVTKKAVMTASETYLIQTFVPYANIISVARIAGGYMLRVNIEDLDYQAGQIEVSAEQHQFIDELTKVLLDKKDVQIKACPIVAVTEVAEDHPDQIQALRDIAEERGRLLKKFLIEEKGIISKRILVCFPRIDRDKDAKPRMEFSVENMM